MPGHTTVHTVRRSSSRSRKTSRRNMADLYSNENFPLPVVMALRELGHDVLTSFESGQANQAIPDEAVLAFASAQDRILLTFNRKHFIVLHNKNAQHSGIIVCTFDPD